MFKTILCDRTNCCGHDAAIPKSLSEPIANLRGHSLNVIVKLQTDSTHSLGVHLYREAGGLCLTGRKLDPCFRVLPCIGVRKLVAKVKPDVTAICVSD